MTEKACRERIVKGQKLQRGGGDIDWNLSPYDFTDISLMHSGLTYDPVAHGLVKTPGYRPVDGNPHTMDTFDVSARHHGKAAVRRRPIQSYGFQPDPCHAGQGGFRLITVGNE